jgi:hypothetical protein
MPALGELLSSEETSPPHRSPWRALLIVASLIVLLILAIFVPPLVNLGKYRRSITASMSEALGRPVYVGGMQLRLLPMPGILMSDFTVDEDPAFGFEPALHASSVVASLRLTSLWRGRLEVSRISLDEANLNLVRNSAGQWSVASVLLRASQIPNAPTAERHASARPRFPYIEATNARIDFKQGPEKLPFSLMNAEFSMWQASADQWRLRLRAQPVRTDLQLHLSDTGELNVEGSLHRAPALDAMPVDLQTEWSGAQLGQVSRLIAGMDSGWRGDLDATATMRGTLGDLRTESRLRVGSLRRQEFQPLSTVDVDATCRSEYHSAQRTVDNITCFWPISSGHLLLTGSVQGLAAPNANLQLEINQVPASFPVSILGLMRPNAQNTTVAGTVNGNFQLVTAEHRSILTGDAGATAVSLRFPGGTLSLPPMHFVAPPSQPAPPRRAKRVPPSPVMPQNAIQLQSIAVPMGEPDPVLADARLTRAGFEIHLSGQAALARLLPAAANFGLLENGLAVVAPKGRATLSLTTQGSWIRPPGPTPAIGSNGTLKLEAVQLKPAFLPAPVDVQSAEITLTPQEIFWQNVVFTYRKIPLQGSIRYPAICNQPVACPAGFTLASGPLDAAALETALGVDANGGFLGHLLTNALGPHLSAWPALDGEIRCTALDLNRLPLRDLTTSVSVQGNKLTFSSIDATTLGGVLHASGAMTIEDSTPHWNLSFHLAGAHAPEVAALFGEKWGSGLMTGEASLTMSGYRNEDLASSATGDFSFTWQNGAFAPGAATPDSSLEPFDRWTAKGTLAKSSLTITSGGIVRAARTTPLRGTITFDRDLDLTLQTRRGPVKIAGTLPQPTVQ